MGRQQRHSKDEDENEEVPSEEHAPPQQQGAKNRPPPTRGVRRKGLHKHPISGGDRPVSMARINKALGVLLVGIPVVGMVTLAALWFHVNKQVNVCASLTKCFMQFLQLS